MTVSRYLRTPDKVSPETAQRIAQVMDLEPLPGHIVVGFNNT